MSFTCEIRPGKVVRIEENTCIPLKKRGHIDHVWASCDDVHRKQTLNLDGPNDVVFENTKGERLPRRRQNSMLNEPFVAYKETVIFKDTKTGEIGRIDYVEDPNFWERIRNVFKKPKIKA